MTEDSEPSIESLRDREAGDEWGDPYKDRDLSELPEWWRDAVQEFEEYGLRPFRPSRFLDGTIAYPEIIELEAEHDADIRIVGKNVTEGSSWQILIDGKAVGPVMKKRTVGGYTLYEIEAAEFRELVRSAVEDTA